MNYCIQRNEKTIINDGGIAIKLSLHHLLPYTSSQTVKSFSDFI